MNAPANSSWVGKSQALMIRREPISTPTATRPINDSAHGRLRPIRRYAAIVAASAVIATGIAIKCACRSANRNVKKGNSVISNPGGSGAIILELRQKSNWPNPPSWKNTRDAP